MDTKDVIYDLRTKNGLSQDELAEKVFVTRQAGSRLYQYAAGFAAKTDLSVLRDAA